MTDSKDYRLYLEKSFETINEKLDRIEGHVAKTNSRVDKLEDYKTYAQHVIDTRPTNCPNLPKFEALSNKQEQLENKLEDALFFVRHPKLFVGFIAVCVIAIIIGAVSTLSTMGIKDEMLEQFNELKYPDFFNSRGATYDPWVKDSILIK